MASPEISLYFSADITLISLLDGVTTRTITVTSRPFIDSGATTHYPILISVNGLGVTVGQNGMPVSSGGSLVLNDSAGSFGNDRRLSDLLQRYSPIEQTITVKAAQTQILDTDPVGDLETIWAGKCISFSKSFGGNETLTLNIESLVVEARSVIKTITSEVFVNAPEKSLGKAIPIIIGTNVVPAIMHSGGTSPYYTYGCTKGDKFVNGGINKYYIKADDGIYREVESVDASTAIGNHATGANYPTPAGLTEKAWGLILNPNALLVIGGRWWFKGQNNGGITPTGNIIFRLYRQYSGFGTIQPEDALAQAVISKSDYLTEVRGSADFYVTFYFENPYVNGRNLGKYGPDSDFAYPLVLSMVLDTYATSTTDFVDGGSNLTSDDNQWLRYSNGQWQQTFGDPPPVAAIYACEFTEGQTTTPDPEGYGFSYFQITQNDATNGTVLTGLDMLVEVDGLLDDSSGTITGSVSAQLLRPDHVLEMLSYRYNGTTWVADTKYDWDEFSAQYTDQFATGAEWERQFTGYTDGDLTLEELFTILAREGQLKLVHRSDGKLAFWPVGYTSTATPTVFTDENSTFLGWRRLDGASVINRLRANYGRNLLNLQLESGLNSDAVGNFTGTLDWSKDTNPHLSNLLTLSHALYGTRELEDLAFNFLGESTYVEHVAELILRQHDQPHFLCTVDVDYWTYRSKELMEIVELLTPKMPAYFGTSSDAQLPTHEGSEVDLIVGNYWKRAQRYRCQIIGKDIQLSNTQAPRMILDLRVISPYHNFEVT